MNLTDDYNDSSKNCSDNESDDNNNIVKLDIYFYQSQQTQY